MTTETKIPMNCKDCKAFGKSIFCNLPSELIDEVSNAKITNVYKKGTTLFFEGNPNYGIFEVSQGKVKISKLTSNGNYTIVDIASPGDTISLNNLLNQNLYSTTAITFEDSVICFFDKNFFTNKLLKHESIFTNVIGKLSKELDHSNQRISSLSQKMCVNGWRAFAYFVE